MTGMDEPEPLPVEIVSSRYLTVMGASLSLGRGFSASEDGAGAASPLVILGNDLWQRRLDG